MESGNCKVKETQNLLFLINWELGEQEFGTSTFFTDGHWAES